jgi:phosphoadenosine phosphosulfate reductase
MLIEETLFGERNKIKEAISRIKAFEEQAVSMSVEGYYVAFSGGKDSIVLLDLFRKADVRHTVHFHITTVDPPELIRFIRNNYSGIIWERPAMSMWQLIRKKMMPPTRIVRYCCEHLKEGGGEDRMVATGIRWAESNQRKKRNMVEGCQKSARRIFLNPIIDWSDDEVWEYIRSNKMPYCELYDQGFKRIGCVGCPMAGDGRIKEFERWPKYENAYKRAFSAAAANRLRFTNQYNGKLRWKDGEDMFRWWMQENRSKGDDSQPVLFE